MAATLAALRRRLAALLDPSAATARDELDRLIDQHHDLVARFEELAAANHRAQHALDQLGPFVAWRPPGHFYSPLPSLDELRAQGLDALDRADPSVPGVDLRPDAQVALWGELAPLIDFEIVGHDGSGDLRYHQPNGSFDLQDAAVYCAMLRHLRPRRLVEVGSGYSSALLLDVADRHLDEIDVTLIEPYPDTLEEVLRPDDRSVIEILDLPVQEVPLDVFSRLEAGDVLFIDSTHVLKPGSDVAHLYTQVVPAVAPGVVVHVHDIFHPFEYPWSWLEEGRAWNEIYLVRALLGGHSEFSVQFFNNWFGQVHGGLLREVDERLHGAGGSIWLRRER